MANVVIWAMVFVLGMFAAIAFLCACVKAHPAKKEYTVVESMRVNLDWGKK